MSKINFSFNKDHSWNDTARLILLLVWSSLLSLLLLVLLLLLLLLSLLLFTFSKFIIILIIIITDMTKHKKMAMTVQKVEIIDDIQLSI